MSDTETSRPELVAGLRALADALEADPNVPLPYHGGVGELALFAETADQARATEALLTGVRHHDDEPKSEVYKHRIGGRMSGLRVVVYARDDVAVVQP